MEPCLDSDADSQLAHCELCSLARPPSNGMAYSVNALLGWFWLLPVTAALWVIQALIIRCVPRLPAIKSFQRICRVGLHLTSAIAGVLILYGVFGWIGSETAVQIATRHLARMGHQPQAVPQATWSWSRWTVRFEDGSFVDVSRNGDLLGGGGR